VRPAERRAVDWARTAIFLFGIPTDDQWLIPLTQAQLAQKMGWSANSGTVAAYLSALGPVVLQRRGGIALDAQLLADLDGGVAAPPATTGRTDQIARDLAMRLGHPTPLGTVLMVSAGTDQKPASIADMAAHLGLHRSTVHRHLQRLTASGRLRLHDGAWTFPPPTSEPGACDPVEDPAQPDPRVQLTLGRHIHSLDRHLRPGGPT
jgi:AraC-like DNA-binding protein